jgi:hypothetical protein
MELLLQLVLESSWYVIAEVDTNDKDAAEREHDPPVLLLHGVVQIVLVNFIGNYRFMELGTTVAALG